MVLLQGSDFPDSLFLCSAGAIEDFSEAIKIMPNFNDSWKRRGQARSALAEYYGALDDLERAIQLTPDPAGKAELRTERGVILQKQKNFRYLNH